MKQRRLKRKFKTSNDFQVRRKGQAWVKLSNDFDLLTKAGDSDVVPMEKNATTIAYVTFIKG